MKLISLVGFLPGVYKFLLVQYAHFLNVSGDDKLDTCIALRNFDSKDKVIMNCQNFTEFKDKYKC